MCFFLFKQKFNYYVIFSFQCLIFWPLRKNSGKEMLRTKTYRSFALYAMPSNLRCSCQLSGNPYKTLVSVTLSGALPLITAVTMSGARLTSDSVRATWERSDLRYWASSNTVENLPDFAKELKEIQLSVFPIIEHNLVRATVTPEIIRLISKYYKISENEALQRFYQSKTAENYADEDTGLYGQSALHIFGLFIMEQDGNIDESRLQ